LLCVLLFRNPRVTAGLKCAIEILPNKYTPIAIPIKGANAIKEISNIPCSLASVTTEPVANTTTIKVPITSAINFFDLTIGYP
jgi:hypothetical protein